MGNMAKYIASSFEDLGPLGEKYSDNIIVHMYHRIYI